MDDLEALGVWDDAESTGSPFKTQQMQDGTPVQSDFSQGLWRASGDLAAASLYDPFVLALAQGVLPK
jgi:hypothetical protein